MLSGKKKKENINARISSRLQIATAVSCGEGIKKCHIK